MSAGASRAEAAALAALLPSARARSTTVLDAVEAHLGAHGGYVAWSGGRDSTVVVDLARQVDPRVPVVWFDSGLEFPETDHYIHALAQQWDLNLHVIAAVPDALTVMASTGGWDHTAPVNWQAPDLHEALVTTPARTARTRFGAAELWGLRASESAGRRALLARGRGHTTRADGTRVLSPIWDWRDVDVEAHLARRAIAPNPVYARLTALGATGRDLRVGLMVDGNNLDHGRATWLRRGWPEQWARIVAALPRLAEWR